MLPNDIDQERLQGALQERRKHEQAPDAVDDAGNAGEQFDSDADRPAQPQRTNFGQEHGDEEAKRHRNDHGDQRCHDRAVDRRQRAKILRDRVPALGDKKSETKFFQRRRGADDQRNDDGAEQNEDEERGRTGDLKKCLVADTQPAQGLRPRHPCGLRHAGTRQRNISHGTLPLGLHAALPSNAKLGARTQAALQPRYKSSFGIGSWSGEKAPIGAFSYFVSGTSASPRTTACRWRP